MISTKTINNQNAITNAVLGTDNNSTTTINGNLLIRDTNGNALTITPSGVTAPTNTIVNNLTVNMEHQILQELKHIMEHQILIIM